MADGIIRVGDHVRRRDGSTGWVNIRPAPGLATIILDADDWNFGIEGLTITDPISELEKIT